MAIFPSRRRLRALAASVALVLGTAAHADSDDARTQKPQSRAPTVNAARAIGDDETDGPTIFEGVPALNFIDAALDRLRDDKGLAIHGNYIGDPYADVAGGLRRGATYAGRLDLQFDLDARIAFAIDDLTLHANLYAIQGRDLSRDFIGNVLSTNDIAALPTVRLYELWAERRFGEHLSVRAGQLGIDVEFLTSDYAATFIDATFGWPGLPSIDLPQGGPAYPLATPAVRVKWDPTDAISILAASFDGLPAGPGLGDPQARDRYGVNFRLGDPPLLIVEAQARYNQDKNAPMLPGTAKVGTFVQFGGLAGQFLNADVLSLATSGPFVPSGGPNAGFYGIVDQQIYRPHDDEPRDGIGVFTRVIAAPGSRNPVDVYADAGFSAIGLVPGRPHDVFGVAGAIATFSQAARALDSAADQGAGGPGPIRSFEAVIEATYSAQVIPGLALQPTFQYIVRPSGGIANPYDGGALVRDAKVLGVTAQVRF